MSETRVAYAPRYTDEDFAQIQAAIRRDLEAGLAKLNELNRMIATVQLPTRDQPFDEERAMQFVRTSAYLYTEYSLTEELRERGAPHEFIERALEVAAELRPPEPEQAADAAEFPSSIRLDQPGGADT